MIRPFAAVFALIAVALSMASPPLLAQEKSVFLQIKPLAMPAVTDKGYRGRMTMTPYVEVAGEKSVQRLCGRLPRLMDSIIVAFEEQPVQLADPAGDMAARQDALHAIVDATIGTGVFRAIHLVPGSVNRGDGTELIEIDGGTRECQPIKALPWTVREAASSAPSTQSAKETAPVLPDGDAPSPLSEAELLKAEAELMAEQPIRRPFPGEPKPEVPDISPVTTALVLIGLGGIMMVIGSYIGYQVAKIRRERRRRERRKARKDRRGGSDRRQRNDGAPASGERRKGDERRKDKDRRKAMDRRGEGDRRFEPGSEN